MRRHIAYLLASAVALSLISSSPLAAQTTKDKNSGLDRIEGTIQAMNAEKRSMTVRQRNRRDITWTILWDEETAITYRNEDATAADLQLGRRVIVLGRFVEDTIRLKALRIDVRSGR